MPRLVSFLLLLGSLVLWYFLLSDEMKVDEKTSQNVETNEYKSVASAGSQDEGGGWGFGVAAANIHSRDLDSHDFHHYGGHIRSK